MPSHGMVMRVNDTAYNITGLHNNTDYTITVYATNTYGNGTPAVVTVRTLPGTYIRTISVYKDIIIMLCTYVVITINVVFCF